MHDGSPDLPLLPCGVQRWAETGIINSTTSPYRVSRSRADPFNSIPRVNEMSTATSTEALVAYPAAVALADLAPVTQPRSRVSRNPSDRPSSSAPSSSSADSVRQVQPSKGESYLIIICVAVITGISQYHHSKGMRVIC